MLIVEGLAVEHIRRGGLVLLAVGRHRHLVEAQVVGLETQLHLRAGHLAQLLFQCLVAQSLHGEGASTGVKAGNLEAAVASRHRPQLVFDKHHGGKLYGFAAAVVDYNAKKLQLLCLSNATNEE